MARKKRGVTFHIRDADGRVARAVVFRSDGYVVRKLSRGGRWTAVAGLTREKREELYRIYEKWRDDTKRNGEVTQKDGVVRCRMENEGCFDGDPPRDAPWRMTAYRNVARTASRIMRDGYEDLDCGCRVEPDGRCQHGTPSTLVRHSLI